MASTARLSHYACAPRCDKGATEEYARLRGGGQIAVPVTNAGDLGTRDTHWRGSVFFNELMTGVISEAGNPISV